MRLGGWEEENDNNEEGEHDDDDGRAAPASCMGETHGLACVGSRRRVAVGSHLKHQV